MKDLKLDGNFNKMFKKFGGEQIENTIDYLQSLLDENPNLTIAVGCDSKQFRRKTVFANTIMVYNYNIRHGAHVIFNRVSTPKIYDIYTRLHKETEYALEIAEWINTHLVTERKDLSETDFLHRQYKYFLGLETGKYKEYDNPIEEHHFVDNIILSDEELNRQYKAVDLHLDYSTSSGYLGQNKSHINYKAVASWLRGMDYRVMFKPNAISATSAADLLLK